MRTTLILLALLVAGCRSHPLAPVAQAEPATPPQMAPRPDSGPTRSVELLNPRASLVTATWRAMEYDAEGRGTVVERTGRAIQFDSGLNLHGWTLRQFSGAGYSTRSWYFRVSIDSEGDGLYDGMWDYDAVHDGRNTDLGTLQLVWSRADELREHDIYHGADIVLLASDRDSLSGGGGVRFSIPLEDFHITRGPVRYKLYTIDDSFFPEEQYIGIVGDGANAAPMVLRGGAR